MITLCRIACLQNHFNRFYSFVSKHYIVKGDTLLSVYENDASDKVYLHGVGQNKFYDVVYDLVVQILINKNFSQTKIIDSMMCYFNEEITGKSQLHGFFTKVSAWNDYQYSGPLEFLWKSSISDVAITGKHPYTRKNRTFSFFCPRNAVNKVLEDNTDIFANYDLGKRFKERMRDKYMVLELRFGPVDGTRDIERVIKFPFIVTNFRYVVE